MQSVNVASSSDYRNRGWAMRSPWLQKFGFGMVPVVCMLLSAGARAEDSEIFFNSSTNAVKPNILFVFDTSGSMNGNPSNDDRPKIDIIKQAMRAVIDEAPPVNIGMARFTKSNGAAILYPVTDIDLPAQPVISETVQADADDAEESSTGSVDLDDTTLNFDNSTANRWVAVRFPSVNVPNGARVIGAALTFYPSKVNYSGGCASDSGGLTLRLRADASDSSAAFSATGNNLSGRTMTSNSVDWAPPTWDRYYDSTIRTCIGASQAITHEAYPGLIDVVQEVIRRPNWCGGNAMSFLIERVSGSGSRRASSFEGDVGRSPTLTLLFSEDVGDFSSTSTPARCFTKTVFSRIASGADDVEEDTGGNVTAASGDELSFNQILGERSNNAAVGLRFDKLNIPQGSTILDARLSMFAADSSTPTTTLRIGGYVDPLTGTFAGFDNGANAPTDLTLVGSTDVAFSGWASGNEYQSPNLNSMVQTLVGNANWNLGNALALVLKHVSGANKHIWQQERSIATASKLTVTYKGSYEEGAFTVRDQLKSATNGFKAVGGTPVADAMAEAARYMRGEAVSTLAGRRGTPSTDRENNVSSPETVLETGRSHYLPANCNLLLDPYSTACKDETISGTYKSPITDACQSNHIVLLTDGEPNQLHSSTNTWVADSNRVGSACSTRDGGIDCTLKTTTWLKEVDQSSIPGKQTINTHAVSFDLRAGSNAAEFMDDVARAGGDEKAYAASSTQEIIEAFTTIINNIVSRSATFVSAGVTVSQSNRLVHEDSLYFSMFQPGPTKRWEGNLKRYRLDDDGLLVDVNDLAAVNTSSDQFVDDAQSWWSSVVDGNTVRSGGAAEQLTNARRVYTNTSATTNVNLSDGNNNLHEANTGIEFGMLGLPDNTNRNSLLQWARGIDVDDLDGDNSTTDANNLFGDPLHSRPALVRYKVGTANELRAYVGTNYGYLHSIDVASSTNPDGTGTEKWAFLPQELLRNLADLRANDSMSVGRYHGPYGLDSSIRVHTIDNNNDGLIDASAGDKAYLYVGMRRGGQSYYALDVSNRDAPVLQYVLNETLNTELAGLGQTWSVPVVAKIKTSATETTRVLIFGGGYDDDQDIDDAPLTDDEIEEGKLVFIVNADTGAVLWKSSAISTLSMNAVPADVAVLDLTGDGAVDVIYAVDMRAQVFRFDISGSGAISGHHLASLQPELATRTDNRRFYAKIDPSFVRRPSGEQFVALSIGSGYRAHPLETAIQNHFYVLRDKTVLENEAPELIELGDLVNITDMLGFEEDGRSAALAEIEDNDRDGWYLEFDAIGEKVLAESVTFDNVVYFTTYLPPSAAITGCAANAGSARLYAVGLLDGLPARDRDLDQTLEGSDRYQELGDRPSAGLINPQFLSTPTGFKLCVGNDCDEVSAAQTLRRVKWQHLGNP